jgi:penicillin-insensitive murein endopeptidase
MKRNILILLPFLLGLFLMTSCLRTEYSALGKLDPAKEPAPAEGEQTPEAEAAAEPAEQTPTVCPIGPPMDEIIEDGVEAEEPETPPVDPDKIPFEDMSDEEIVHLLDTDPAKLGSMSVGRTNSGALFNGVPMPEGERWQIVNPAETWGTRETVDFIIASIDKVHDEFPNTPPLHIGDISDKDGGRLNRHVSHQAGRDVDLSWYFKDGTCNWWTVGTANNLDLPRTWALVRAFFTETDVELILIDRSIQHLLYDYAVSIGEDREWLNQVFQYPQNGYRGIIRHARGHKTHIHARFYNREAQEMGRRAYTYMIKRKMIKPPTYYVYHKVRKGETLGHMARRYGTSVSAIKRANGLRSSLIRAGKSYRIPKRGGVKPAPNVAQIPARRIPPDRPGMKKKKPKAVALKAKMPDSVKANPIVGPGEDKAVTVAQPHLANGATEKVAKEQLDALKSEKAARESLAQAGAVKELPVTGAATKPTKGADIAPAPKPKPKPKTVKKKSSKRWITYKVRAGDNLWTIARRYNTHVKDIQRWNGLKSNTLKPGQKLKLYVKR